MHTFLETKRRNSAWKKIIFPRDSLIVDHLPTDQLEDIIKVACEELSSYDARFLFMPHEVAHEIKQKIQRDDYNDNELAELDNFTYDLVCGLTDILFKIVSGSADYQLSQITETHIVIFLRPQPIENF